MDFAACQGEDLVLFFGPDGERQPERDVRERKAKAICVGCPVRFECLDYALNRPEKYGLWFLSEEERGAERRRRMRRTSNAGFSTAVDTKRCSSCRLVLPAAAFYRDTSSSDGLAYSCRACRQRRRVEVA